MIRFTSQVSILLCAMFKNIQCNCFKAVVRPSINVMTEPENGAVFTDLEGSINATIFTCNIFDSINTEQATVWSLQKPESVDSEFVFNSDLSSMFHARDSSYKNNQLTIHNLTSRLDGVTIFCGTEAEFKLAFFTLRINREFFTVSKTFTIVIIIM